MKGTLILEPKNINNWKKNISFYFLENYRLDSSYEDQLVIKLVLVGLLKFLISQWLIGVSHVFHVS